MSRTTTSSINRRGVLAGLGISALPALTQAQQPPATPVLPPSPPVPSPGAAAPAAVAERRLVLASSRKTLKPGAPESDVFTVSDQLPGPVIRIKKGEPLDLTIENKLNQPTALHIHGLRGAYAAEGMPGLGSEPIAPGESRKVRIETPDAGTFIYVPVLPGRASEQAERGLGGVFVVEEPTPPAVDHDHVLALDDLRLDEAGKLVSDFGRTLELARSGRLGNGLFVNGKPAPEEMTVRPGARIRLRLASLATARIMPMKFENLKATVVTLDGQPCDPFDPLKRTVVLLPGSRYDVMLDAPAETAQEARVLVALGTGLAVLKIKTAGDPLPARPAVQPIALNDVPPAIRLQNATRTELSISGGMDKPTIPAAPLPDDKELAKKFPDKSKIWQLNGGFSNGFTAKPLFTVKRGAPVVIALVNRTAWSHVITVHGHVFRLLHPLDDGWEPYFLDTLHLPEGTTSRIAFDAVNVGKWAIRSTIAEHYDAGLYTWFEVVA